MEIATCKNCGKLFNYIRGQALCPACQKEMDAKFKEVKKYVYDHPNVGIHQLAKDMEVSVQQINRWVREERLIFSEDSDIGVFCEKCGALIRTGRLCDKCKKELMGGLSNAAGLNNKKAEERRQQQKAAISKMRFLDQ